MRALYITFILSLFTLSTACVSKVPSDPRVTRAQVDDVRDADDDGIVNSRDFCNSSDPDNIIDAHGCSPWKTTRERFLFTIFFDLDKSAIRPDQISTLRKIQDEVMRYPDSKIAMVGDTSPEGSDTHNQKLGTARAEAIRKNLIELGVDPARIDEFVWSDSKVKGKLVNRKRRTIVLVRRTATTSAEHAWTIYSASDKMLDTEVSEENKP